VITRSVRLALPVHLGQTMGALQHGRYDPTIQVSASTVWRAMRTPIGVATARFTGSGHDVVVDAWGEGSAWVTEHAPEMLGARDQVDDFVPHHPVVRELHRRNPGLRIAQARTVLPLLMATILGQRVTSIQNARSWASLTRRFSERAPGPAKLWLPADPIRIASLPYYRLHPSGIERGRADTIRRCAASADAFEALVDDPGRLEARLRLVPGIGPWTTGLVLAGAAGDPDAVPIGDLHLPSIVSYGLAGEASADDDRMLELLEPFRGHRARVVRLLKLSGVAPARHAPRARLMEIEHL
jgi:3-methyladenine DNA glycosylase/8-oxoguanine DNA glycosylase